MEEAIQSRNPIDIDLGPNWDEIYSGICLKTNNEIFILMNFNEELNQYNGFSIFRTQDIQQYRLWEKEEITSIKKDNHKTLLNRYPWEKWNSIYDCLNHLSNTELVAIFTKEDTHSYFVGRIDHINPTSLSLEPIDKNAKWVKTRTIPLESIIYVGFDTEYEKQLLSKSKRSV